MWWRVIGQIRIIVSFPLLMSIYLFLMVMGMGNYPLYAQPSPTASTLIQWPSPYVNQIMSNQSTDDQSFEGTLTLPILPPPTIPAGQTKYAHTFTDGSVAFTAHPLPAIVVKLGQTVQLIVDNQAQQDANLTQSLLSAQSHTFTIPAQQSLHISWQAQWVGASTYMIRRGKQRWVGTLIVMPSQTDLYENHQVAHHTLSSWVQIHTLNLTRSQSQADTRRAQPWHWSLQSNTPHLAYVQQALSTASITQSLSIQPSTLTWDHTLALVNVSDLPIALDLPPALLVHGTHLNHENKPPNLLRIPVGDTRGPLHVLAPGQGCLIWSPQALDQDTILAFGYTALGSRSWTPTRLLAHLNTSGMRSMPDVQQFTQLPTPQLLQNYPILQSQTTKAWLWSPQAIWTYQGSHRTQAWYMSGSQLTHDMTGLWEIRNLSSSTHGFATTLGPHYALDESTQRWTIRAHSWLGIRKKVRVLIPQTHEGISWNFGVLYASEREFSHPLQKDPN